MLRLSQIVSDRFARALALSLLLLILQSLLSPLFHSVYAQFSEDSLTVKLSATGEATVTDEITTSTIVPRITLSPISPNISNLLAVDESDIILKSNLTNNEIIIDTLGAAHVTLTYNADILNSTQDIWSVHYTSTTNSTVVLPSGSELLFVNNIPIDIVENTVVMPPGDTSLSYKTRGIMTGTFSVAWEGIQYQIGTLSASQIRSVSFDQASKSIVLGLDSQDPILVIIPKTLLGGPYEVHSNNEQQAVQFKEYYQNVSHSWVRIEPPSNSNSIRITGTTVIPEFPITALQIAGITTSLFVFLSAIGKRLSKHWQS
jgi:hypothetical protein